MFCKYCGKEIEDNSLFCGYCGKKVENVQQEKRQELEENEPLNSPSGNINTHEDFKDKSDKAAEESEPTDVSLNKQDNKKSNSIFKPILVVGILVLATFLIFKFLIITKTDLQKYADTYLL